MWNNTHWTSGMKTSHVALIRFELTDWLTKKCLLQSTKETEPFWYSTINVFVLPPEKVCVFVCVLRSLSHESFLKHLLNVSVFLCAHFDVTCLFLATWRETSFPASRPWRRTLAVWGWAAAVLNVGKHTCTHTTLLPTYSKSPTLDFITL